MRLFFELARRSLQRHLAYRSAALAGLVTNFFFGLLRAAILLALYGERDVVAGMTTRDVITYTALTQAVIGYLSIFGWHDLMDSVHSGEIAGDLLKPMGFFRFWLARDCGRALAAIVWRGVTILLLYALFFDLSGPQSLLQWLALVAAVLLSWLVSFAWSFLINLAAFWTPNARGIGRFGYLTAWLLSGFLMPLRFFPPWLVRIAYLTPFPHMLNSVVEIYLGLLEGRALLSALLLQAFWAVLLMIVGQQLLRIAVRRLVILGG